MANAEIAQVGAIEQLTERLRSFQSAGLPKPPNYLLSDYLRFLVDHELLPRETSVNLQAIYNNSRYGGVHIDAEVLSNTVAQLDAACDTLRELDRQTIEDLANKLAGSQPSTESAVRGFGRPPVNSALTTPVSTPEIPAWHENDNTADFARFMPLPNRQARFWTRIMVGGILWTLIVLVAGYFGHDKVSSVFQQDRKKISTSMDVRQDRQSREHFITKQRAAIDAAETDLEKSAMMRSLAQNHLHRREHGEYYFIYESLLKRDPNSATDKIKLAELLLDITTPWYHDPARARQLTEEAVATDPTPHALHMLAEAMYQTGDTERAFELIRQANAADAALHPRKRGAFRARIKRFRWAMDEKSATIPESSSGLGSGLGVDVGSDSKLSSPPASVN